MLQNYFNIFIFGLTILQTKSLFLTLSLSLSGTHTEVPLRPWQFGHRQPQDYE